MVSQVKQTNRNSLNMLAKKLRKNPQGAALKKKKSRLVGLHYSGLNCSDKKYKDTLANRDNPFANTQKLKVKLIIKNQSLV